MQAFYMHHDPKHIHPWFCGNNPARIHGMFAPPQLQQLFSQSSLDQQSCVSPSHKQMSSLHHSVLAIDCIAW
jgi:hypothetical protein